MPKVNKTRQLEPIYSQKVLQIPTINMLQKTSCKRVRCQDYLYQLDYLYLLCFLVQRTFRSLKQPTWNTQVWETFNSYQGDVR